MTPTPRFALALSTTTVLLATSLYSAASAHADDDPRVPRSPQPPP